MQNDSQNSGLSAVANEVAKAGDIARRTAFSFFLFFLVLTALLALSWYLLVPELTRVQVGGAVRDISQLKEYKNDIEVEIRNLESRRTAFLLPTHHDLYSRIKAVKDDRVQFQDLRRELNRVMRELVPDRNDVVVISSFYFDASKHTAEIRGDIRNIGPRSMTVLARFVEAIQDIDFVIDVETSRYERREDPRIGFFSPFTLRIRLDRA